MLTCHQVVTGQWAPQWAIPQQGLPAALRPVQVRGEGEQALVQVLLTPWGQQLVRQGHGQKGRQRELQRAVRLKRRMPVRVPAQRGVQQGEGAHGRGPSVQQPELQGRLQRLAARGFQQVQGMAGKEQARWESNPECLREELWRELTRAQREMVAADRAL